MRLLLIILIVLALAGGGWGYGYGGWTGPYYGGGVGTVILPLMAS